MNRIFAAISDLIFPQVRCLGCDEPRNITKGSALCDACAIELDSLRIPEQACPHCLSGKKAGQGCAYCAGGGMQYLDGAFAPFMYTSIVRQLIRHLKFGPVELAASPLASAMVLCVSGQSFDSLVPVPLHQSGERERGVNQSMLLCRLIGKQTGIPILNALAKIRRTKRQSSLPGDKRAMNVRDAYSVRDPVRNLRILLVDDVRTSGATARECARVLREAGASSVSLLTAAVADGRGHHDGSR